MKVIYNGNAMGRICPDLGVDNDPKSRSYGWLFAKHPDGQWVTVADLQGVLVPDFTDAAPTGEHE